MFRAIIKKLILSFVILITPGLVFSKGIFELSNSEYSIYENSPYVCSYSVLSETTLSEDYSYICHAYMYMEGISFGNLKDDLAIDYYISGSWNTAFSNGSGGNMWRIISVSQPTSNVINYYQSIMIIENLPLSYTVDQVDDQHYKLNISGGMNINGDPSNSDPSGGLYKLISQSSEDLYTGGIIGPVFSGSIQLSLVS